MCRNFTYEVVGQRRKLKVIKKNCSSKNKCHFIFFT
jgi:RecA/RadA recombinase